MEVSFCRSRCGGNWEGMVGWDEVVDRTFTVEKDQMSELYLAQSRLL
jgi:hypothetical protein